MASPAEEIWRRSADAYGSYLRAVGALTNEYVRALGAVARSRLRERSSDGLGAPAPARPAVEPPPQAPSPPASLVLEAAGNGVAFGAFLVANAFDHEIEATVVASPLRGAGGELEPAISFEPTELALAPGAQAVVRVALAVDERMEPGLEYHGELSVPSLPGTSIPILARKTLPA